MKGNTDCMVSFNVGDRVTLKEDGMSGTIKGIATGIFMVELDNGDIDAFYTRELKYED